jgi:type IV secretory pathway VirB10-like protein
MNDFLQRIRWPNVARAAAVLGVVVLLISWPHLRGRAPELPPPAPAAAASPVPADTAETVNPAPDADRGAALHRARRKAAARKGAARRRKAAARRRRARAHARHHHRTPRPATTPPSSAAIVARPPAPAPAGAEFKP